MSTKAPKPAASKKPASKSVKTSGSNAGLDATTVNTLKGVGEAMAVKLATLGIYTLQDVLFHLPFRYQDRTRLRPIGGLRPGDEGVIEAEVVHSEVVQRQRRSLLVRVADGTGSITLRFFHFSAKQAQQFERGKQLQCFGEARRGPATLEMVHPEYRLSSQGAALQNTLTPFYPATEGVQQGTLRKLSDQALAKLHTASLQDLIPQTLLDPLGLPNLSTALNTVHRPSPEANVQQLMDGLHPAHRRLALEELVAHRLAMRQLRDNHQIHEAPVINPSSGLADALRASLAFDLTGAQARVLDELLQDTARSEPMLRLVQGDVGAGKTIVAALAAAHAVECGYQVALMAPTEILAEQHLLNFCDWFEPLGISVGWLSGKLKPSDKRSMIESVAMGQSRIVVGTHALFQADVEFQNLGLAIVDEQHRFGVHQRLALRNKGAKNNVLPHQLIMTATPIPRTLAMTAYADLDVSVIDELPPGRKPVTTVALESQRRADVVQRVSAAIEEGRQVYWVCTLIDESEFLQAEAAEDAAQLLAEALPNHRVGLVHGRMKSKEKDAIMAEFKSANIDLLVATTVIEVGVDVPNASLMIIENAERLGLSQLHQLRGRVGRGSAQSSCILLYQGPLSKTAKQRIGIMRETNDGFVIAERDLEIRGAGEVLGTRQTGMAEFRIAKLGRDDDLLDVVSEVADQLAQTQSASVKALIRRWIGEGKQDYGGV